MALKPPHVEESPLTTCLLSSLLPNKSGIIKKWKDNRVTKMAKSIANWLEEKRGLEVIVEDTDELDYLPNAERLDVKKIRQQLDFIVCLGG